ncbi:hypothetical protein J1N35_041944 [Gossypium stocksii]|uniref:B box-type domain-containing protein n=1 Tax=Gossypium stocksii TaxID=47602 RepID=A0A9D3UGN8_9ROSI|nr:hypothetical protein J1N35_041944 [Gossypium stocksii]
MCKGLQQGSTSSSCLKQGVSLSPNANPRVSTRLVKCELCNSRATLYCQADDAYLCRKCDKWVHDANFLAQRHIRCFLCNTCQNLTQRYLIGASHEVLLPTMVSWSERRHYRTSDRPLNESCPKGLPPRVFLRGEVNSLTVDIQKLVAKKAKLSELICDIEKTAR